MYLLNWLCHPTQSICVLELLLPFKKIISSPISMLIHFYLFLYMCAYFFFDLNEPHGINSIYIRRCGYSMYISKLNSCCGNWVRLFWYSNENNIILENERMMRLTRGRRKTNWSSKGVRRRRRIMMRNVGRDRATALSKQQSKLTIKFRLYRAALPWSYFLGARPGRSREIYMEGWLWVESCRCCWCVRVYLGRNSSIYTMRACLCVCVSVRARVCSLINVVFPPSPTPFAWPKHCCIFRRLPFDDDENASRDCVIFH